jgi:hypothetical protein
VNHSIFALEVCARLWPESPLRAALAALIADAPERLGLHQKWSQYQRASQLIVENLHVVERGCWDYFNDDDKARDDYAMWTNGMLTEEGVRGEPSGLADPYRGGPRYLTFTMAMLILQESPTDRMMRDLCAIPEADLWRKATFARILRGVARVSFASVASDVLYLIPRDDEWALTAQDLEAPKFEYLRMLQG